MKALIEKLARFGWDKDKTAVEVSANGPKREQAPTSGPSEELEPKLIDVFCETFGEKYRHALTPETDMDSIKEWDSENFIELVLALEEAYGVTFSDLEAAQFFQLGHIQRIVRYAVLDLPHDDVSHACCQIHLLGRAPADQFKVVLLSGSSTREGFLTQDESLGLLRSMSGRDDIGWYNISVTGLVAAETLQLIETTRKIENGLIVVGYSPIILGGCGTAEFKRAAAHRRFPFAAPLMDSNLAEAGYRPVAEEMRPDVTVETWVERYLKGRDLEELQLDPYLYPTRAPWDPENFHDEDHILRYFNRAILNHEQSIAVNSHIFRTVIEECRKRAIPVALLQLTLNSGTADYLERLGGVVSRTADVLVDLRAEYNVPFVAAVDDAGIADADFRDPAHIFRKREEYSRAAFDGFLRIAPLPGSSRP